MQLDDYEKELLDTLDDGEWNSAPDLDERKALWQESAKGALKKDARVNIRISSHDLIELKRQAVYEGIPYQTYITSILHKVSTGAIKA